MKLLNLFFIFFVINTSYKAQQIIFQDIFLGGVTGSGLDFVFGGAWTDTIDIHIDQNSTIKKVIILYNYKNYPENNNFTLNDSLIQYVPIDDDISLPFTVQNGFGDYFDLNTGYIDITNKIDISDTNLIFSIPYTSPIQSLPSLAGLYIIVLYENLALNKINFTLIQNNKNSAESLLFNINNLNEIDTTTGKHVGLILNSSAQCDTITDGSFIYLNNNNVGLLGGDDTNSLTGCASIGSFYYENMKLFGIGDDMSNSSFQGVDAIANISTSLQSLTSLSIGYNYQTPNSSNPNAKYTNVLWQMMLAYTTPCDTFSTTASEQVNICKGDTAYLSAAGGNNTLATTYEWEPQDGLSCYNCATPYYSDTVSKWYTVRIWNTDSCSKVIPVNIHVNDNPLPPTAATSTTQCSDSSGVALVSVVDTTYTYSVNNGTPQISNALPYLWGGDHLITVTDTNGCTANTVVNVPVYYPTANFTASPTQGNVPLEVYFTNNSTNATQYIWYINNDTLLQANPSYTFDQSGQFPVTLIAIDTYPQCADTASVIIFATYPFTVVAPSYYEYQEDKYTIYTSGVKELNYTLYNSIGQKMYNTSFSNSTDTAQHLSLWSGYDLAKGTYLYRIVAKGIDGSEKVFSGKVVVM